MLLINKIRFLSLLLVTLLLVMLSGCFSTPAKQEFFYLITAPRTTRLTAEGPAIFLNTFEVAPGYDVQRIAYEIEQNEIHYYGYHQWVSEPAKMVTEAVMRYLRNANLFRDVDTSDKLRQPDALLSGTIEAIGEIDRKDQTLAHLAMTFVLKKNDSENDVALMRYTFDKTVECEKRHPRSVAAGLTGILSDQMRILSRRMITAIDNGPGRKLGTSADQP